MKKLFTLLLLANTALLFSQQDFRLGINIDPTATWFAPRTTQITRDGMRLGIKGGMIVEYYFRPHYAIATGINMSVIGGNLLYEEAVDLIVGKDERTLIDAGTSMAYNITYINIPVSLKLKTNEIGYFTYFAQIGVSPMINSGSWANSSDKVIAKDFMGKEINFFGFDYFIGAGVEYSLGGQTSLTGGLFFNNGLSDVLSNKEYKAVINTLAIRMGVLF